jgi:hypothetical protein
MFSKCHYVLLFLINKILLSKLIHFPALLTSGQYNDIVHREYREIVRNVLAPIFHYV